MTLSDESISTTRRRAWSFTSTFPFGSCRTAAMEPSESVLVAVGVGSACTDAAADFAGACAARGAAANANNRMDFMLDTLVSGKSRLQLRVLRTEYPVPGLAS